MIKNSFYNTIKTLRTCEEVILYNNILTITPSEKEKVIGLLQEEYENESLNYPFVVPAFHSESALWAAERLYFAAQLILYRKNEESELDLLFPEADFEVSPSTILSIDLCLRFFPDLLNQLKIIDAEDRLIVMLEKDLYQWHYSGIGYPLSLENIELDVVLADQCLQQLYLNRIVECKNLKLAKIPELKKCIKANFGMYEEEYWKDIKTLMIDEHSEKTR